MASVRLLAIAFIAIVAASSIVFAEDPNNVTPIERSGPISSWPASWTDFCNRPIFLGIKAPVLGTRTTVDEILPSPAQALPNTTLGQIYDTIINSTSFKHVSAGLGWVTILWALESDGGTEYVIAQFLLLSGNHPDESVSLGGVQAFYNLDTGAVSVQTGLVTNCPG